MYPIRGLYTITDGPRPDFRAAVEAALAGGTSVLQYRDKTRDHARRLSEARWLAEVCAARGVPMIVNDDIRLAAECGASGVHLGADDSALALARERLGTQAIIGISCYDSIERARLAAAEGADYVAFGAFFSSPTKPSARSASIGLLHLSADLGVPRVAIGGITPDNARLLIEAGADCVAVISAVFGSTDIRANAERFSALFPRSSRDIP
jgi:thiamine-phosphate pyrophosphorylase